MTPTYYSGRRMKKVKVISLIFTAIATLFIWASLSLMNLIEKSDLDIFDEDDLDDTF
jgi:hypothetical protein